MPQLLLTYVLPLAFSAIQAYIKNSSSKNDDQVLKMVKQSVHYLARKHNNNMSFGHNESIRRVKIKKEEA